jgi:hypothetical protein
MNPLFLAAALPLAVASLWYGRNPDHVGVRVLVLPVLTLAALVAAVTGWPMDGSKSPSRPAPVAAAAPKAAPKAAPAPKVVLVRAQRAQPPRETMAVWSHTYVRLEERRERKVRARAQAREHKRAHTLNRLRKAIRHNVWLTNKARNERGKHSLKYPEQALDRAGIGYLRKVRGWSRHRRLTAQRYLKRFRANQAPRQPAYVAPRVYVVRAPRPASPPVVVTHTAPLHTQPPPVTHIPSNGGTHDHTGGSSGGSQAPPYKLGG